MPFVQIFWQWEEAFDKFGFDDGDGMIFTDQVASFLEELGFEVTTSMWGMHNTIIQSISYCDIDLLAVPVRQPDGDCEVPELGYSDPRVYLRPGLVAALDREFAD